MAKAVLITHNDFDGVTCAILFSAAFPEGRYYLENYDTVDQRVKEVITQERPQVLILADISVSEETARMLDDYNQQIAGKECLEKGFVQLLDHHKTAQWLSRYYQWAVVNTEVCAAKLLWQFLTFAARDVGWLPGCYFTTKQFAPYETLVYHANDYDMWIHQSPHSATLNDLLYAMGPERFIKRFLQNPSVTLTEAEKLILEVQREKDEKYIEEAVKNAKITDRYAVTMAERCISQIGAKLLELAPIAVIVNAQKGTVSLRGKGVDVADIAKRAGGGGHTNAAGFTLPKHLFHSEIIDLLSEIESAGEDENAK